MPHAIRRPRTVAAVALVFILGVPSARAQDASAWEKQPHAAVRLIAGTALVDEALLRAGIEIRLEPGWKTYWRYPGDSGVPPLFDFAGSANVKTVTVEWPAPERFADGAGGHSIGYVGHVVFPLRIARQDAAKGAALHVKLGYAICGNLCIPAEADLDLRLSAQGGAEEPALAAAQARVPRRVALGGSAGAGLAITAVHREQGGAHERVVVDVAAPANVPIELFVEGPTSDWALPLPEPIGPVSGVAAELRRFGFDLDGLPAGAQAEGASLTFTAVSPDDAIEVKTHLD